MNQDNDPLFGNHASDLFRAAADAQPTTGSNEWLPPAPEELQALLPGYQVLEFIARGGMGAVYRGVQISLNRQVAIKILPPQLLAADPQFAERFKQEAQAMAQFSHPGIVSVFDFGEMSDGTLFFVMEFIDGTDVGRMIQQQGRLSSAHAMAITAHVCDALQCAHEHGVVHRDIKPANIMVGRDGRVKVADFGLAKSVQSANTSLTVTGHVMGTPHFVAPEALTLGMSIDHRADIYAVGVMLYQMLTGKLPQGLFEMPSLKVPGLDPRYDAIVASAMREDREQRYQRILDMRRALDAIMTQPVQKSEVAKQTVPSAAVSKASPPKAQVPAQPRRPPAPPPRKKVSAAGWVFAGVMVAVAAGVFQFARQKPRPSTAAEQPIISHATSSSASLPPVATRKNLISSDLDTRTVSPEKPMASAPAANQTIRPPATQSSIQPIEVKLEFMNADKFFDIGGYQPVGTPLRSSVPKSITKAPSGLVSPLYGEIFMGPPESERTHVVIVDNPNAPGARLLVDSNANGDLTDDTPAKWQPGQQSDVSTGAKWSVFQGEFFLELKMADGTHPARIEAFRNPNSQGQDSLWFHPQYGRVGRVTIAGKRFNALLYDDEGKGDFSHSSCTFRLDLNGDLTYRSEQGEVFPVSKPFTLDGVTYELSGLTPDGAAFGIVRSSGSATKPSSTTASKTTPATNKVAALPAAPALAGPQPSSTQEYRNFTDAKGRTIRAALVSIRGDDVTLQRDDGHEFTIKAATLSLADIEYLKTRGNVVSETPATAQVPTTAAAPSSSPSRNLAIPEESRSSTLQQTTIFGLARDVAASILADARLKSNPKGIVDDLQGMVADKRATLVANLSVSAKSGTRSRVEGTYGCESEVVVSGDGGLKAMFAITSILSPSTPKLTVLDVSARREDTLFLGSFDEDRADPKTPVRLVFVTLH